MSDAFLFMQAREGRLYAFRRFEEGQSWSAADAAAARIDARPGASWHLATLTDAEEQSFANALTVDALEGRAPVEASAFPWIGLVQAPGAAEPGEGWGWVTGEPFAFDAWRAGEPNGDGDGAQLRGGGWNDQADAFGASTAIYELSAPGARMHLLGTAGDDVMLGAGANDVLTGFEGMDELRGRGGDDRLDGDDGADAAFGGGGSDLLRGGAGRDALWGGGGGDRLRGGADRDHLTGGGGDDLLIGGAGRDVMRGGKGADVFALGDGAGVDRILDFRRADSLRLEPGERFEDLRCKSRGGGDDTMVIHEGGKALLLDVSMRQANEDFLL